MRIQHFSRYLSDDGTTTGNKNANGNYSGALEEWYLEAAAGETLHVYRLLVAIEDTGGGTVQEYGNLNVALTNGIEIEVRDEDDNVLIDLTDSVHIKTNADWGTLCFDVDRRDWGSGNDLVQVRWTFTKFGGPISLDPGQKLVVKLNDDLTGLIGHYFVAQGRK